MGGIFGDLIDSFTGAGAKRALREGMDNQIRTAGETRDQQIGATKAAGTEARGYITPYAEQGGRSYGLYNDTIGLNGADARSRAQDLYNSDDMLARNRALDLKRSGWAQNASGNFNSGTAALADSRIRMQGYGDWQNRLAQGGQMGYSAAGNLSGIAQNEGNALAGVYGNYGNAVGNAYGQNAQGMAQANNAFAQNIIGLGGTLVRAFNPLGGINYLSPATGGGSQGGRP
jgi:hypothetical protein